MCRTTSAPRGLVLQADERANGGLPADAGADLQLARSPVDAQGERIEGTALGLRRDESSNRIDRLSGVERETCSARNWIDRGRSIAEPSPRREALPQLIGAKRAARAEKAIWGTG